MSVEMSGIQSVLARIAQIQAGFPGTPTARSLPAPVMARSAAAVDALAQARSGTSPARTGSSDFAVALASAAGGSGLSGLSGLSGMSGLGAGIGAGTSGPAGADIIDSAKKYLGVPYVFGGVTPAGLDCSGLVQRAYGDLGISLPRIASDQAHVGVAVPSLAQARPGDILAFGEPAHHVALYVGDNKMIAAPQAGDRVKIQSVYETPTSIRRVVPSADQAGVSTGPAGAVGGADGVAPGSLNGQPALSGLNRYASLFTQNEARYHLPKGLLAAVAHTESGGNPAAVSPAGAQGLMQLMPGTAKGLGVNPWVPAQAVQGAAQLLSNYLRTYGSVPLALAAYNAGPGAVEQYGGVPPYNETQNYVTKITGMLAGRAG
ncbi:MAG TPA: transglycosylase SLT domain-containing protein [Jatrophihabitans sp.]|jgi:cell wall-associated NlpC family hydrolase|uniref:transglycosylase SLT domain-containing protein n=1 Tax=Jatrophihabitans sp. TaxID=1932789 RepID=UPI002EF306C2